MSEEDKESEDVELTQEQQEMSIWLLNTAIAFKRVFKIVKQVVIALAAILLAFSAIGDKLIEYLKKIIS